MAETPKPYTNSGVGILFQKKGLAMKKFKITVTVNDKETIVREVTGESMAYDSSSGIFYIMGSDNNPIASYPIIRLCECIEIGNAEGE